MVKKTDRELLALAEAFDRKGLLPLKFRTVDGEVEPLDSYPSDDEEYLRKASITPNAAMGG